MVVTVEDTRYQVESPPARLCKEPLLRTNSPYQALSQASRALSAGYDMDETLQVVVQLVAEFTDACYAMIMLEEAGHFVSHAGVGSARDFPTHSMPKTVGIAGLAYASKQIVFSADVRVDPRSNFGSFAAEHGLVSAVSIPLVYGDEAIGVLTAATDHAVDFSEEEISLISAFADQAAVAVERARKRKNEHEQLDVISALLEGASSISTAVDLPSVLARLAEATQRLIGCDQVSVWLLDEATGRLHAAHPQGVVDVLAEVRRSLHGAPDVAANLERAVVATRMPAVVPDTSVLDPMDAELCRVAGVRASINVPIVDGDRVLGVISSIFMSGPRKFTGREQAVALGLARLAGQAIIRARTIARLEDSMLADERGSMAREVHDTLAQELVNIGVRLDLCSDFLETGETESCMGEISAIRDAVTDQIQSVRRCIAGLRPLELEKYGLSQAVRRYVDAFADRSGLACELLLDAEPIRTAGETEFVLYRVLQEALTNVRKHARATRVTVRLMTSQTESVSLTVADNGHGRSPGADHKREGRPGIGLSLMRERVERVGGSLDVRFVAGQGTTVSVRLPLWAR